jgi:hypothetical protein
LVRVLAYVDDRKAGMDKPNVVEDLHARPVGTTMHEGLTHRLKSLRRGALAEREHAAADATHRSTITETTPQRFLGVSSRDSWGQRG